MKIDAMLIRTHNLYEEAHWVSRLRENFMSGSDGEGLETSLKAPRQSFTRQLLFKQIKQNFPLRYFWGESTNAIKMQVYCVLIAQLLMVVIRKKAATKKSFANMITVIRLHLTSYVGLLEFIKDTYKAWRKTDCTSLAFGP